MYFLMEISPTRKTAQHAGILIQHERAVRLYGRNKLPLNATKMHSSLSKSTSFNMIRQPSGNS